MEVYETRVEESLARPVPRAAFFDELLVALREMWEMPIGPEVHDDERAHSGLIVAGSVAAAAAGVGAAGAWYGFRKRHRRGSVA
ncbi:MAG: hypothetical protein M3333_01805 [Actinomycetota bacterium]|nr:hypothetical protein [Actinomycetota bacterium]